MKKIQYLMIAFGLILACFAGCGSTASESTAAESTASEPAPTAAPAAAEGAGTYSFTEKTADPGPEVPFTVTLADDGSFQITEENPTEGTKTYSGDSFIWKEKYFTTEAVTSSDMPEASFFDEDGSCIWIITGEGTVVPMNYVEPARTTYFSSLSYADNSSSQVLDVYLPEEEGVYPVIIVVHGGGFKFGSQNMAIVQPIFDAVNEGYAVVSADYRKSGEAAFPAALSDIKAAVRWVRANAGTYGFDADHIAVWGESAGAYLAITTALTPDVDSLNGDVDENLEFSSSVNALVDFYGPVNLWELDADAAELGMSATYGSSGSFESDFLGQPLSEDEAYTKTTWWKTYVGQFPADFSLSAWIQVGDADTNVPYLQSVHFAEELAEVIGEDSVQFSIIPGAAHEDAAFYNEENLADVYAWLDSIMK